MCPFYSTNHAHSPVTQMMMVNWYCTLLHTPGTESPFRMCGRQLRKWTAGTTEHKLITQRWSMLISATSWRGSSRLRKDLVEKIWSRGSRNTPQHAHLRYGMTEHLSMELRTGPFAGTRSLMLRCTTAMKELTGIKTHRWYSQRPTEIRQWSIGWHRFVEWSTADWRETVLRWAAFHQGRWSDLASGMRSV